MNYYNKIKTKLINNELFKYVKDYSINQNELKTIFDIGELLTKKKQENAKIFNSIISKYANNLSYELSKKITYEELLLMMKFYKAIMEGMTLNNHLTWFHYKEILRENDFYIREYYISECTIKKLSADELRENIKNDKNRIINI